MYLYDKYSKLLRMVEIRSYSEGLVFEISSIKLKDNP